MTIGVDLGDETSDYCVLDEEGAVVEEGRVATSQAAFRRCFGSLRAARIAMDRVPRLRVLLVGDGFERPRLLEEARRLGGQGLLHAEGILAPTANGAFPDLVASREGLVVERRLAEMVFDHRARLVAAAFHVNPSAAAWHAEAVRRVAGSLVEYATEEARVLVRRAELELHALGVERVFLRARGVAREVADGAPVAQRDFDAAASGCCGIHESGVGDELHPLLRGAQEEPRPGLPARAVVAIVVIVASISC